MFVKKELFKLPVTKRMSTAEKSYYNSLINGLDEQITLAINYLDSNDYDEEELFLVLDELIDENINNNMDYITSFYLTGSSLGYKQLGKKLPFNKYDEKALEILWEYNVDLEWDLNKELSYGIKETLKDKNSSVEDLLLLTTVPILGLFSVDTRAEMIARTEHSRGVNTGTLQAYSNSYVNEVNILTSGLSNVCDDCIGLEENNPYSLEEAMSLLPLHPLCACSYQPVTSSIDRDSDVPIVDLTI